jgi:elongation factor P
LAIGPLSTTHVILYAKPQEKVINMASPTDIRKGRVMVYQGAPHLVLEMQHRTQGRQAGFVQTTLRNLQSGSTTTTKFRSTDNVEFMHTTTQKLEFSYKDTEGHHFMDLETYEDTVLPSEIIGEDDYFLVEGNTYDILLVDGEAIRLELPASVEAKVIEAPEALRGDTAGNVLKPVTISSGITIQVPLFIKKDDVIKISTNDRSYLGRVN